MRRGWPAAMILSLALGASCAHTKTTESDETKEGDKQASGTAKAKEPGADHDIRGKLAERGFLKEGAATSQSSTREAIRRFQHAEDLPATGIADQETVKRLGLDPEKVFRKATVKD